MNFGSVRSDRVKLWGGGLIFETNCIFEYKPSPHFRLDVVYKMGGVLTGHYGIYLPLSSSPGMTISATFAMTLRGVGGGGGGGNHNDANF